MKLSYLPTLLAIGAAAAPLATDVAPSELDRRQSIPVGTIISACRVPGTVAMTFDDGPYAYTEQALNLLNAAGMKATFFLNGQNWANINSYANAVRRMDNEGHQIGSHTWSHIDLTTTDANGIRNEMVQLETALLGIVGKRPTYFRAPYLATNSFVLQQLGSLGYKVIDINIDTMDWNLQGNINAAAANFYNGLNAGQNLALAHDVHQNTVQQLIPRMINSVRARNLRAVTVGECLGEPKANWYATTPRGGTTPPPTTTAPPTTTTAPTTPNPTGLPVSTDATCGAQAGFRCPAGNCCSRYNWCGTSSSHCGTGCQSAFGICS